MFTYLGDSRSKVYLPAGREPSHKHIKKLYDYEKPSDGFFDTCLGMDDETFNKGDGIGLMTYLGGLFSLVGLLICTPMAIIYWLNFKEPVGITVSTALMLLFYILPVRAYRRTIGSKRGYKRLLKKVQRQSITEYSRYRETEVALKTLIGACKDIDLIDTLTLQPGEVPSGLARDIDKIVTDYLSNENVKTINRLLGGQSDLPHDQVTRAHSTLAKLAKVTANDIKSRQNLEKELTDMLPDAEKIGNIALLENATDMIELELAAKEEVSLYCNPL